MMSFTNLTLQRWDGEWPEYIEVSHEGIGDLMRYIPDCTCRMEYAGEVPPSVRYSCYFCSECGSPIYNDMEPSYCLYCGARVVSA